MAQGADLVLARLQAVKRVARGRWMARCPGHQDRGPSLSIRETDDGRLLVHCFAGCAAPDLLSAIGLKLEDLFPDSTRFELSRKRERQPFTAAEAVEALRFELMVVYVILADLAAGKAIDAESRARSGKARERCIALMEALSYGK